jgi:hypothetical protein
VDASAVRVVAHSDVRCEVPFPGLVRDCPPWASAGELAPVAVPLELLLLSQQLVSQRLAACRVDPAEADELVAAHPVEDVQAAVPVLAKSVAQPEEERVSSL